MPGDGLIQLNPTPDVLPVIPGDDTKQLQNEVIQLNSPGSNLALSQELASTRAYKINQGLQRDFNDTVAQLRNGMEESIRHEAAMEQDSKKLEERSRVIHGALADPNMPKEQVTELLKAKVDKTDPRSVVEDQYARKYMAQLDETSARNDTNWNDLSPEAKGLYFTAGTRFTAQQEYIQKQLEDAEEVYRNQSTVGFIADQAKTLFPLYTEFKMRGFSDNVSRFSGLLGTNLEETVKDILRTPKYEDFKDKVDKIMTKLKEDNPGLAVQFAQYLKGKSPEDKMLDNVFSAIDLSVIPTIAGAAGTIGRKAASKAITNQEVKAAVKDMVTNASKSDQPPAVARPSAAGDATEAAVQKHTNNVLKALEGSSDPAKQALEELPRYLRSDVDEILVNPGHWGREQVNRLAEQANASIENLTKVIAEMTKVNRTPAAFTTEAATRRILDNMKDTYPGISNNILDIRYRGWNNVSNTHDVDLFLGRRGGELFFSKNEAEQVIKREGLLGAQVKSKDAGLGYYIVLNKPLNEQSQVMRDLTSEAVLFNKEHQSRKGPVSDFLSWLKTPEDTMSFQERVNRKTATYTQNVLEELLKKEAKYIQDVARGIVKTDPVTGESIGYIRNRLNAVKNYFSGKTKDVWSEWERTLKAARDIVDPITKEKGHFFKSPGDLDDFYQRNFGRLPSFEETEAYFAYKRILEFDRGLRNLAVYRNKSRLGAEQHRFTMTTANGQTLASPFFDGMQLKQFPGGKDDSILIIGDTPGSEKVYFLGRNQINSKQLREYQTGVLSGKYRVVEIFDPEARPFEEMSQVLATSRPRYVLSKNIETKPLSFDQVPRRGGGHFDYDYEHYIKQANIRPERIRTSFVNWYEGDTTIMPVSLRKMGQNLVNDFNDIRTLLVAKKFNEAEALFKSKMPVEMDWKEFKGWFEPKTVNGKKLPPRLNVNEPFYVVPKGKSIVDLDKSLESRYADPRDPTRSTFRDGTRSGSAARQFQVQYTGKRDSYDMMTLKDVGTPGKPLYNYEPAALVDPIPSMNRALQRIINSTFMDDYKTFSIQNWLAEASSHLAGTASEIATSPFWYFKNPKFKQGTPPEIQSRLMSNHWKINQFVGIPSSIDTALHSVSQRLADSLYSGWTIPIIGKEVGGPKGLIDPQWAASTLKDPFSFIRTMTFHAYLGLYALPQVWMQAQTYALIAAISPRHAVNGTQAAFLHQWARLNPSHVDSLDKIASAMKIPGLPNWKPGEWKEAFEELHKTGFGRVGGEYALLDTSMSPKLVEHNGKQFLNAGAVFFREGERSTHYGAWYTAYKEFRTTNPVGRITNEDRSRILERADLLTSNMSRASQSLLHNGVLSFPAQFLTYQIRNAELIWGKRLGETVAERNLARARILTVYGALYGLPGAAGVSGLPLRDYIRQYAIDNGYVIGENYLTTLINEGIPAMFGALATGSSDTPFLEDPAKNLDDRLATGNKYNIGSRYGNQGFQLLQEALSSDQTAIRLATGAAGSTVANTISNSTGFLNSMWDFMKHNITGEPAKHPMKAEDIIKAGAEIASVSMVNKAYVAIKTGEWLNKNGDFVDSTSPANALFMAAFGLNPQGQQDMFNMSNIHKDEQQAQKTALKFFVNNARSAFRAMRDNNPQQYDDFMTRAFSYLDAVDYPIEKRAAAISLAAKGHESMIAQMERNFYLGQDTPNSKREERRKTWETIQQMQQQRNTP